MAQRGVDQRLALRQEHGIAREEHRAGALAHQRLERARKIVGAARVDDDGLPAERARRFLAGRDVALGVLVVGIHEQPDQRRLRHDLAQDLEALRRQCARDERDAGRVAARLGHALHESEAHRIGADGEHDRNRRRGGLRGSRGRDVAGGGDDVDLARDQLGRERGQAGVVAVRPAVLDREVASFGVARFGEAVAERARVERVGLGRGAVEEAQHGCRALRAGSERPRRGRAADPRHERSPFHRSSRRGVPGPGLRAGAIIHRFGPQAQSRAALPACGTRSTGARRVTQVTCVAREPRHDRGQPQPPRAGLADP